MSVLLFSPVRQDPAILSLALRSHRALKGVSHRFYIDDNLDPESSRLLLEESALDNVTVEKAEEIEHEGIGPGHNWNGEAVRRMERLRNRGLDAAKYAMFSVDSDVIVNPETVIALNGANAAVAAEVFWTKWPGAPTWMPQVWDRHPYGFDSADNVLRLKHPGVFNVRGLGACTFIGWEVIGPNQARGPWVGYDEIPSLKNVCWGEDRWFCIRAECARWDLKADTHYPPFHVYRPEQLEEATAWYDDGAHPGYFRKHWLNREWEETIRRMYPAK
jgi:hypothetical protein